MIEKMKFVNIMGPIDDIDRVKEAYLADCDIQIEDAVMEIGATANVSNFVVVNHYADILKKAEHFAELVGIESADESYLSKEEAIRIVDEIDALLRDTAAKISEITLAKKRNEEMLKEVTPFIDLEFPIEKLLSFHFIKYRFGRIPVNSFKQFEAYLYDREGILLEKSSMDKDYVYCVYFVPEPLYEEISTIFSSLHFETITLSDELNGTPYDAYNRLNDRVKACDGEIHDLQAEQAKALVEHSGDLSFALRKLKELSSYTDIQRFAAKTKDDFYIIVGWMAERDAKKLEKRTMSDEKVVVMLSDQSDEIKSSPPTKLKNFIFFRPFENLIKMYGLPQYGELDPTAFFGISYSILFGMMFGDLGQGLTLSIVGYALYRLYNIALASVLVIIGLSSAFFGLMYGSVFGYENLIPSLWVSPMHDINTVLITTLCFGIALNMFAMILHIMNGVKSKDWGSVFFDPSGVSGIIFYIAILIAGVCAYTGYYKVTTGIALIFIVLPLVLIMFREPLSNKLEGHKRLIHGSKGDFFTGLFFETFEVLLNYVTNTISFIRVGAFALCHVGMMSVVLMLAGAGETNLGNPIVMILGNIFVMCLEGLIVGIQALRLQFYEMFSRFFKGGGKEFKSFKKQYKL